MLKFIALAVLAGGATASSMYAAGFLDLPQVPQLSLEICAAGGLAMAFLVLIAGAAASERKSERKLASLREALASFENAVTQRLASQDRSIEKAVAETASASRKIEMALSAMELPAPAPSLAIDRGGDRDHAFEPRAIEPRTERPLEAPAGRVQRGNVPSFLSLAAAQASASPSVAAPAGGNVVKLDQGSRKQSDAPMLPGEADILAALEKGAVEAWFQPTIHLPSRKTRILECCPHLQVGGGLDLPNWRRQAGHGNLLAGMDLAMLLESLRLLRELKRNDKPGSVLWKISADLLADSDKWREAHDILRANRNFASYLYGEIALSDFSRLGAEQLGRLRSIKDAGYRLSVASAGGIGEMDKAFQAGIFDLARAPATAYAGRIGETAKFEKFRKSAPATIEFAALGVLDEDEVIALIDQDVMLAQGPLVGRARPLKRASASSQEAGRPG